MVTLLPRKNSRRLFVCLPYSFWIGGCLQSTFLSIVPLSPILTLPLHTFCALWLCSTVVSYGFFVHIFFSAKNSYCQFLLLPVRDKQDFCHLMFAPFLFSCLSASTSVLLSPQSNIFFAKAVLLVVPIYFYTE